MVAEYDKKLLFALDSDSRQSYSSLAKKFKTSPQRIQYRIDKLVRDGVITSFMTTLSTKYIGYPLIIKVYLQYAGTNSENEKAIHKYLQEHKSVNWIAKTLGDYDLFFAVMATNLDEFSIVKQEFFSKFGNLINAYDVSIIEDAHTMKRTYLVNGRPEEFPKAQIHQQISTEISEEDLDFLELIADNSRITVLELSNKLKIDAKTARNKLKKLTEGGAIQGFRININREKIGLKYYKVFIQLAQFELKQIQFLKQNLLSSKYVIHLINNIGKYEIELEMEVPDAKTLHQFVGDLRNNFSASIKHIMSTEIVDEMKLTWIPKR